jgi:hypothetical protein
LIALNRTDATFVPAILTAPTFLPLPSSEISKFTFTSPLRHHGHLFLSPQQHDQPFPASHLPTHSFFLDRPGTSRDKIRRLAFRKLY